MAKFELPSGSWVECRDVLTVKDRKAINAAIKMQLNDDNSRVMTADVGDAMLSVLLERTITAWGFPTLIPADNPNKDIVEDILGLEDWDFLMTETKSMLDQVLKGKTVEEPKK
jgi:hypothetical protein